MRHRLQRVERRRAQLDLTGTKDAGQEGLAEEQGQAHPRAALWPVAEVVEGPLLPRLALGPLLGREV